MKLFGIEKTNTHKIIYLLGFKFGIRDKSVLSKEEFEIFLSKYDYILNQFSENNIIDDMYSDYIWQFWFQGFDNAPKIVKKCVESVKYFCSDKKIIYLDKNNLSQYIKIPEHILYKHKKGIISNAHFSDYIRTALLSKYGGLWLDATVLLTDKIPNEIFKSDLFLFKDLGWSDNFENCKSISPHLLISCLSFLNSDIIKPNISNWFIFSKRNNSLIESSKKFITDYWEKENNLKNYFIFHYWVRYAVLHNKNLLNEFKKIYDIPNIFPHLIQANWTEHFDLDMFKKILSLSPIHKLTYKNLDNCNKECLDYILNLDFKTYEKSFDKRNWGFSQ